MRLHVSGKVTAGIAMLIIAALLFFTRDAIQSAVYFCGIDGIILFVLTWSALRVLPLLLAIAGAWNCLDGVTD